jgi:hypothetical protein
MAFVSGFMPQVSPIPKIKSTAFVHEPAGAGRDKTLPIRRKRLFYGDSGTAFRKTLRVQTARPTRRQVLERARRRRFPTAPAAVFKNQNGVLAFFPRRLLMLRRTRT